MEIPFFFYAKPMMRRLGVKGMLGVAFAAYSTRLFAYTILTNPWWVR